MSEPWGLNSVKELRMFCFILSRKACSLWPPNNDIPDSLLIKKGHSPSPIIMWHLYYDGSELQYANCWLLLSDQCERSTRPVKLHEYRISTAMWALAGRYLWKKHYLYNGFFHIAIITVGQKDIFYRQLPLNIKQDLWYKDKWYHLFKQFSNKINNGYV